MFRATEWWLNDSGEDGSILVETLNLDTGERFLLFPSVESCTLQLQSRKIPVRRDLLSLQITAEMPSSRQKRNPMLFPSKNRLATRKFAGECFFPARRTTFIIMSFPDEARGHCARVLQLSIGTRQTQGHSSWSRCLQSSPRLAESATGRPAHPPTT